MSSEVYVTELPMCDIHQHEQGDPTVPAAYDGKTDRGPWANMCAECFRAHGVGLGTGRGQRLIVGEQPPVDRRAELNEALSRGASLDELEDIIGDGDIAEYL